MQSKKIRLYTNLNYRSGNDSRSMMPIILAQLDQIGEEERIKKHHARATHFELVSDMDQADWCALPDNWPEYVSKKKVSLAKQFAGEAEKHGKLTLVWSGGDPEWIVPIRSAILVQEGLYKRLPRQVAFAFERPAFIEDYLHKYKDQEWNPLPKTEKPTIGFCGQAAGKLYSRILFYVRNSLIVLRYRLGVSAIVPNLNGYPVDLRAKTLRDTVGKPARGVR